MPVDDAGPGRIQTRILASGLQLVFDDSIWDFTFPADWRLVPVDEDDLWAWEEPGVVAARVRLRRHPRVQWEVDVVNMGADVATVSTPTVAVRSHGVLVPWFAGSAGEVVVALQGATVEWSQRRGSSAGTPRAFSPFPEPLVLRPGQAASAAWRRQVLPAAAQVPAPSFVPRRRYLPAGESLEVEHSDAALLGPGLDVTTTAAGSDVLGEPGLHDLSFLDARGTAIVEVGWFSDMHTLVRAVLADPGVPSGLRSWLMAAAPAGVADIDALDVALAEALEDPDVWGVLAGMRAATLTDLPVGADVRRAACQLWDLEDDDGARQLLVAHALVSGWEPAVVAQWLRRSGQVAATDATTVLASIGLGRITSEPVTHDGRDVVLAQLFVAAHGESAASAEWEAAVDAARARLLCQLSRNPDPEDIAWLLAEVLLT